VVAATLTLMRFVVSVVARRQRSPAVVELENPASVFSCRYSVASGRVGPGCLRSTAYSGSGSTNCGCAADFLVHAPAEGVIAVSQVVQLCAARRARQPGDVRVIVISVRCRDPVGQSQRRAPVGIVVIETNGLLRCWRSCPFPGRWPPNESPYPICSSS
jgi:hypothetical protein